VVFLSILIVFLSFVVSQGLIARIYLKEQNFYQMREGVGVSLKRQLKCVQTTSMKSFSSKKENTEGKSTYGALCAAQ